jgi:hypothetical protein
MERTFGRLVGFDERSRQFSIRTVMPEKPLRSYTWKCRVNLDQGSEGACTGFSVAQEAAAKPVVVKNIDNAVAIAVYRRAQELDPWAGKQHEGSTVLAAMKAAVERGWYREYRWAFNIEDLAVAVGYVGPAVLGINWHRSMSCPDDSGRITVSGGIAGGHAILCNGINKKTKLFRLHNSWGPDWGLRGECFIHWDDLAALLNQDGEACIPLKRLYGKL